MNKLQLHLLINGLLLASSVAHGQNSSCLQFATCASCASVPGCGWANGVACYPGTPSGASYPFSSNGSWAWTPSQCPQTSPCLNYTNCSSCTGPSTLCGWANGVACYPGTPYGGASFPYSSNISWVWGSSQCPMTPAPAGSPCLLRRNCTACTGTAGCGWANGVACYPGYRYGAAPPYSSNISWAWVSSQCPPPPSCLGFLSCSSCTLTGYCGWVNGTRCYPGDPSGPWYPYPRNVSWDWWPNQCNASYNPNSTDRGYNYSASEGSALPEGTYCGSLGEPGIIISHGILSYYRTGGGGGGGAGADTSSYSCRIRGSYTLRDSSIVDFAPYFSTCPSETVLSLRWYNTTNTSSFILTGTHGHGGQLSWNQCHVPNALPSGRYETTSNSGAAIVLLRDQFLLLFDGCNVSGTYTIRMGSSDLTLHLLTPTCTGRSQSFTLMSASYTNLTDGYWFLTISYTINKVPFAESTTPVRWPLGWTNEYSSSNNTLNPVPSSPSNAKPQLGSSADWRLYAVITVSAVAVVSVLAILSVLFIRRHYSDRTRKQITHIVVGEPVKKSLDKSQYSL